MADPSTVGSAFFPYHHHHHHLPFDQTGQIPFLCPPDLQSLEPESQYPTIAQSDFAFDAIADPTDPLVDPVLHELLTECQDAGLGLSGTFLEINDVPQGFSDAENPMPISAWPGMESSPSSSICNSCQVLREITHSNGSYILKLEIHGILGIITHAVLEKCSLDFSSQNPEYQTFDFSQESMSGVKQFLVGYFEDRKHEGYIVLQDPLWEFYEALSVGYGGGENMDIDTFFQLPPTTHSGNNNDMNQQDISPNQNEASAKPQKIPLSAQRERTGKLRLKDFAGYLHLPIEEAARRMNICPTVMKKICRRDGLLRWPYRKIRSIQRKISIRSKSLSGNNDAEERERAKSDILELQQQLARISEAFFD